MSANDAKSTAPQAIFFSKARRRGAASQEADTESPQAEDLGVSQPAPRPEELVVGRADAGDSQQAPPSRVANIVKLLVFAWLGRWVIRYFEVDRSLRGEPDTPHISMLWLGLTMASLLPFVSVYLYASVWRRRVLGEPLDLQNWQSSANTLVHAATAGLLLSWAFATVALFPGHGLKSLFIVLSCTICMVAITDAVEGIFS
ncbi:hypothetical protein LPJ75_001956 [Coemansia sp. RSA 2598]|nr:hypothetical protein LPJ75_001956 [Coemansia sp. RSA 2598]